jgi:hypothetical protein
MRRGDGRSLRGEARGADRDEDEGCFHDSLCRRETGEPYFDNYVGVKVWFWVNAEKSTMLNFQQ